MAKFIAISGPSASGKSQLFNELLNREELLGAVFLPDIFRTVWTDLVEKGLLSEYDEINKDAEFLCIFIQRVTDYYRRCIETHEGTDKLVIIDSCWVDLSIYATINMWYMHMIKEIQESLLSQLYVYDKSITRLYITQYDDSKKSNEKYRSQFKRYNIKYNRPLEIQHYELFSNLKNAEALPSSEVSECADYIIEDLMDLGYI